MRSRTRVSTHSAANAARSRIVATSALIALAAALPAHAGTPITNFVYSPIADIDKDGRPGGTFQPTTFDEVACNPLLAIALVFAGQQGVARLPLDSNPRLQVDIAAPTAFAPSDAEAADIDCDGDTDLILCDFEFLSTLSQTSCGAFGPPAPAGTVSGSPFGENCVKLTDLSGDTCPEIVAVSNNFTSPPTALVQVFPNNGAGVFAPPNTITIPNTILSANAVGDIDGDGIDEVAVATGSSVSILRRTAPNTLTPLNAATGQPLAPGDPFSLSFNALPGSPFEVTLADVNADGRDDIVASNFNDIHIRTSNGNATFAPVVTLDADSGTRAVVAKDLNADGTAEVFAVNANIDTVYYWRSTGPLQWAPRQDIPVGTSPRAVRLADVNADALPDLVTLNRVDADALILFNTGDAVFTVPQRFANSFAVDGGYTSVAAGDFNADGHTDIFASTQRGDLDLFLNRADASGLLNERINRRITFNPFLVASLPP
ncbi:MAG: VCBS repeat-containing protein, partial [Planctomycetes bacterium]|nr:VCBS repeat-containing protein [Planctomycetota bacterium]